MALTCHDLLDRVAAQLAATLGVLDPPWHESRVGHDAFGKDPRTIAHLAWALAVPTSSAVAGDRQRARGEATRGTQTISRLSVRWSAQLQASALRDTLGLGYDAEAALRNAVLATASNADLAIVWRDAERSEVSGHVVGRQLFDVLHRLPLA